jgi:hypothetical protein
VSGEDLIEFLSTAQRVNNSDLALVVVVIAEDLASTCDEYFLFCQPLGSVPPLSDSVRQNDTERERIDKEDVFAGAVSDQPLR